MVDASKSPIGHNETSSAKATICTDTIHSDVVLRGDDDNATINDLSTDISKSPSVAVEDVPHQIPNKSKIIETIANQDVPSSTSLSEVAGLVTETISEVKTSQLTSQSETTITTEKNAEDLTKLTSLAIELDKTEAKEEKISSTQDDTLKATTDSATISSVDVAANTKNTNSSTTALLPSIQPTKSPSQRDQAEMIESIHQSMEYIIPNLHNLPHNILTLLQTFGPLTQSEIEYNLPPTNFVQDIPKILEIMVVLNAIHHTDGLYYFNDGDVRSDVVLPHEILGLIEDTEAEIRDSESRILLLKEELKKNVTIKNRGKSIREFMKNLALKYDGEGGIRGDIVYATALRSLNVEVGLKRKAAAAAAAVSTIEKDVSSSHNVSNVKKLKTKSDVVGDKISSVVKTDQGTNDKGTSNNNTSTDIFSPEEDSSIPTKSNLDSNKVPSQDATEGVKANVLSSNVSFTIEPAIADETPITVSINQTINNPA